MRYSDEQNKKIESISFSSLRQHPPDHDSSIVLAERHDVLSVARKLDLGHLLDVAAVLGRHRIFCEAGVVENLYRATRVADSQQLFVGRPVHGSGLES